MIKSCPTPVTFLRKVNVLQNINAKDANPILFEICQQCDSVGSTTERKTNFTIATTDMHGELQENDSDHIERDPTENPDSLYEEQYFEVEIKCTGKNRISFLST